MQRKKNREIFKKRVKIAWAFLCSDKHLSDYDEENLFLKIKDEISGKKRSLFPTIKTVFEISAVRFFLYQPYYDDSAPQTTSMIKPTDTQKKLSYTSFITENGQRFKVVLPDSSIVWLNSGTTLSYPDNFLSKTEKFPLTGKLSLG